jgi:type IV pilus assembly protein PilA
MFSRPHNRLRPDAGFTLIELLIVIVIVGILLAIAVPSYLGFKDRANKRAAESDIREAIPSMEAYYSDQTGSTGYTGATATNLRATYDSGLSQAVTVASATTSAYCIGASVGTATWSVTGPGATAWYTASKTCSGASTPTP